MELPEPPSGSAVRRGRSSRKRIWPWVVLGLFAVYLVGTVIVALTRSSPGVPASPPERAIGASERLSSHDLAVLGGLGAHVSRFNLASLPLITDYLDPSVSAAEWVGTGQAHIEDMQSAVLAMEADILSIEDAGVRNTLQDMTKTLREELGALIELRSAVAALDPKAERAALRHLRRAAAQRQRVGLEMLDRLRPFIDADTLQRIAQAVAQELDPAG